MIAIRPATSDVDVSEAFDLGLRIFSPYAASTDYESEKRRTWHGDPTFERRNLVLAYDGTRLVGLIRLVPRLLFRADQPLFAGGISSVCVDPDFRQKGYSNRLMESALSELTARGCDIALLFARRAADHYYNRFGFWGLSSYSKLVVNNGKGARPFASDITTSDFDSACISVYSEAFERSYRDTFGRFDRNDAYWRFVRGKIATMPGVTFRTLHSGGKAVGYAIVQDQTALEYAVIESLPARSVIAALWKDSSFPIDFEIPPTHLEMPAFRGLDVTVSSRECEYGGHMVKILNPDRLTSLAAERIARQARTLNAHPFRHEWDGLMVEWDGDACEMSRVHAENVDLDYATTQAVLGTDAPTANRPAFDPRLPFSVSRVDAF